MFPLFRYLPGASALVQDSPHSGTVYPADFAYGCELPVLRRAEDTHVKKLYDFAPAMGAYWLKAFFPRSCLDINRDTNEVDVSLFDAAWPGPVATKPKVLSKVRLGKGLIWRSTDDGMPIYARKLAVAEAQARIAQCWQPYHAALAGAIDDTHARHGYSIHRRPRAQRHSIQLEINRKLYMNEDTLAVRPGLGPLKTSLRSLVQRLLLTDPRLL